MYNYLTAFYIPLSSSLPASDASELTAGHQGNGEGPWEVVVTVIALIPQVDRVLLELTGLSHQGHLTQEVVNHHVMVVDLEGIEERSLSTLWL